MFGTRGGFNNPHLSLLLHADDVRLGENAVKRLSLSVVRLLAFACTTFSCCCLPYKVQKRPGRCFVLLTHFLVSLFPPSSLSFFSPLSLSPPPSLSLRCRNLCAACQFPVWKEQEGWGIFGGAPGSIRTSLTRLAYSDEMERAEFVTSAS